MAKKFRFRWCGGATASPAPARVLLYGYGAYGVALPDSFDATRFSLIDRGFLYAIAHVRGGTEKGSRWYEDGKLEHKANTFRRFHRLRPPSLRARPDRRRERSSRRAAAPAAC